jgi:hypothetical protein
VWSTSRQRNGKDAFSLLSKALVYFGPSFPIFATFDWSEQSSSIRESDYEPLRQHVINSLPYFPIQALCNIGGNHNQASGLNQFKDFAVPLLVLKVDSLRTQGRMYFTGLSDRQHGAYFTEYIR